jgi:hypothetical protein
MAADRYFAAEANFMKVLKGVRAVQVIEAIR